MISRIALAGVLLLGCTITADAWLVQKSSVATSGVEIIVGTTQLTATGAGTVFLSNNLFGSSDNLMAVPSAVAGTAKNLFASVTATPNVGGSYIYTVFVNGSSTGITCTITNPATTCNDTTHTNVVAVGQNLSVRVSPASSPGNRVMQAVFVVQ